MEEVKSTEEQHNYTFWMCFCVFFIRSGNLSMFTHTHSVIIDYSIYVFSLSLRFVVNLEHSTIETVVLRYKAQIICC